MTLFRNAWGWMFLLLAAWIFPSPVRCEEAVLAAFLEKAAWQLHDVRQAEDGAFEIVGSDPQWISPAIQKPLTAVRGFFGELSFENCPSAVSVQLFWGTDESGYTEASSYRFTADPDKAGRLAFFLPFDPEWLAHAVTKSALLHHLRLDVDAPVGKRLRIRQIGIVQTFQPDLARWIPPDLVYPVLEREVPSDVSEIGPWREHDLMPDGDGFWRVAGEDPFWLSPNIDIFPRRVKGVFVEMDVQPSVSLKRIALQVFWRTYELDFNEIRSFRLIVRPRDGAVRFFLPLLVLPPDDLLKHLRIDLDGCASCKVRLRSVQFVTGDLREYRAWLPRQLIYGLGKNVYGRNILEDIAANLRRDKIFLLLYGCCIAGCVWLLYPLRGRKHPSVGSQDATECKHTASGC
ncbi:hypothetical protein [Desulfatirhabdium butyrativorans]|uniref:hypothetical protein n=1 Tax=Desulfatirhabdium butyrativorans TaxID=340467 RepID=UPI0004001D0E|nr:hypothetical protein [Desulfatirhabdium butyrativorans]